MSEEAITRAQDTGERLLQLCIQHSAELDPDLKQLLTKELVAAGCEYAETIENFIDDGQLAGFDNRLKDCLDGGNWADLATLIRNPTHR